MERADSTAAASDGIAPTLLELPQGAACGLGAEPFGFRHRLVGHDAFDPDALGALCDSVPAAWIVNHDAERDLVTPRGTLIADDRRPSDVVRDLASTCNWFVVRHLEHISPYRGLLDSTVDEASATVVPSDGRMLDRGATVFLGSPHAVVPVHIDRHHNFLLQIIGTKEFGVGSFDDASVQAREIERNFGPRPAGSDLLPTHRTTFRLGPGDGVYIPANAFHWASGGPEASVAFSCAFRTEMTNRAELIYEFNAFMGRLRLPHRAPSGGATDAIKASAVRLRRRARRRATGS